MEMYCPQCGQQQASAEMRFCSRCGFPLSGVTELLAQGGLLSSGAETEGRKISPRRKGVQQGVMMMLLGTVIVPVLAIFNKFIPGRNPLDLLVPLAAVICFAGGMMRILYALVFEGSAPAIVKDKSAYVPPPAPLNPGARVSALPPPQSAPVSNFTPRRVHTAELVQPPSVTENTTRLLDEEKPAHNE
ncbi:MAG TPA: hypothetical protein VF791_16930 [Pyrinomonadaceae bacterium]